MSDDLSKVDVLQAAVRRIIARCEAIEEENATQLEREQTEAASGFLRGERHLAKSIRRELHDLTRNVAGPAQTDMGNPITDPIAKRMETAVTLTADQAALLRKVLAAISGFGNNPVITGNLTSNTHRLIPMHLIQEARDAVTMLPEPVDPDVAFAREIIADAVSYGEQSVRQPEAKTSRDFRSGECDAGDLIARVVKQLRSRALERGSREG